MTDRKVLSYTHLRSYRAIVLGISLHGEIAHSYFMFVLQQGKNTDGWVDRCFLWYIFEVNSNACARLNLINEHFCGAYIYAKRADLNNPYFLLSPATNSTFSSFEIFKLKYASIIARKILEWIPRACSQRPHATKTLKTDPRGYFFRCIYFIGERKIVLFLSTSVPPFIQPL